MNHCRAMRIFLAFCVHFFLIGGLATKTKAEVEGGDSKVSLYLLFVHLQQELCFIQHFVIILVALIYILNI